MSNFLNGTDPGLRQTRTPTTDNFAAGVDFTAGSTTQLTLSADPGSEDNVEITFDGIQQHRNTYSVSGAVVTFDAAIGAGVSNVEATFTTTIPAAEPADNSVTLAKMAGGTDGNLITFDANGDPAYVATGTSGQVLTSNGAGAAPTMQDVAGGAWELISHTARTTDAANVDFTWTTGVATSYSIIKIYAYDLSHDTDSSTTIRMRVYENTTLNTSTYRYNSNGYYSNSTTIGQSNSNAGSYIALTPEYANFYSDQNNTARYEITIQGEASAGSGAPRVLWTGVYSNSAFNNVHCWGGALSLGSGYPCTGVRFYASTGNIGVGATIIGLKQS